MIFYLVSETIAQEHLINLRRLLQFSFAQPVIEYLTVHLEHCISNKGISKGNKVDAMMKMPAPTNVSSLRSFLGSVQLYGKFLPNLSTLLEVG